MKGANQFDLGLRMKQKHNFFNINDLQKGIQRQLGKGLKTSIFCGEKAMISIVVIEPNSEGKMHSHPQEQWGFMLEGSGVRIQGSERIKIKKGDFWLTPSNVEHGIISGKNGAKVIDFFSPGRDEYKKPGSGFGI